jgi:hypothetical protein
MNARVTSGGLATSLLAYQLIRMKLKLFLVQQDIDTYAEVKELPKVQQKQLALELRAYFGKKVALREAFDGECIANYWQAASADDPDKVLYDFWQINTDSGGVFHANTTDEVGVEMIQGSFGAQATSTDDRQVTLLAEAFSTAERIKRIRQDYEINERGDVVDFKSDALVPGDTKQWVRFIKNQKVSEALIRKYHADFNKSCWNRICETSVLSEPFLLEFAKKINWDTVSQFQRLSESFIREQQGRLNWTKISFYQTLSENFIREFQDIVNWDYISSQQVLSEPFIRNFADRISWDTISWSQSLSYDFIREFQDKISWKNLCMYPKLSEEFLREFTHKFDWFCWLNISQAQALSSAFIDEFSDRIQWRALSMNPFLTDDQLRAYKDKLDWGTLVVFGRGLSEPLLREFQAQISLPESSSKTTWMYILNNKQKFAISDEFRREILNTID